MAQQGTYPMGGRSLALTDTATGVVTGATADIPISAIVALVGASGAAGGPTSHRPTGPTLFQYYFDTTIGMPIFCSQTAPTVWVNAAGVAV